MQTHFFYVGHINTHEQINDLFKDIPSKQLEDFSQQITPALYQFRIENQDGQSIVYRSHDQIIKLVNKYNKLEKDKHKYPTNIHFQSMKDSSILNKISQLKQARQSPWFIQFFDLNSPVSGKKISVKLKKQSGGRYSQYKCCLNWKQCKSIVLSDGVVIYNQSKQKIQQFMHFGKDFHWETSPKISQLKIVIHSYHRKLSLKAQHQLQFFIFIYTLQKYLKIYKKQQMQYRFNSFAPIRYNNEVQFFVDGSDYFLALAHAMQKAQYQVFLCGWWISPEFNLIRPCVGTNLDYRLDKLLTRIAKRGVKIYIVVYYQSSFLTNDSAYTIQALQTLHQNIKVLRHPQIVLPTYWSHHQKLIVIDQSQAFMGGLDICYGRFDTPLHLINQSNPQIYPGIQYNNCRIADFVQVREYKKQNVGRHLPRLPWHDVALTVKGRSVKDLSRHFIQYWNYASYQTHFADRYVLLANSSQVIQKKKVGLFGSIMNDLKLKINKFQHKTQNKKHPTIQIQEQYRQNIIQQVRSRTPPKKSFSLQAVIKRVTPSKYNDNGLQSAQRKDTGKDLQKRQSPTNEEIFHIAQDRNNLTNIDEISLSLKDVKDQKSGNIQQLTQFKQSKRIQKTQKQADLRIQQIAKIQEEIQEQQHIEQKAQNDYIQQRSKQPQINQRISMQYPIKRRESFLNKLFSQIKRPQSYHQNKNKGYINNQQQQQNSQAIFTCQVLRSASQWSIGCNSTMYQKSIYDAYLSVIGKAEKFIYIENQFFISSAREKGVVKNKIMQAIANRIIRAIESKQKFKVIIMMPLIPGFAGQLDDPQASLPRVIMNWQYKTLCRGQQSLIGRLKKYTNDPFQYIQVLSLRTHGLINQFPVTEIIYLHSKLIIVDDRYLICGSANINDRSMEGNRDSQLCLFVQAAPTKQVVMGGQLYRVVQKIQNLRMRLWQEHFGIVQFKLIDAVCDKLWQQLTQIAKKNTQIYRKLFGCYPDDQIKVLHQIRKFKKIVKKNQYDEEAHKIQGHAVQFPLNFLQNQKLTSFHPHAIST